MFKWAVVAFLTLSLVSVAEARRFHGGTSSGGGAPSAVAAATLTQGSASCNAFTGAGCAMDEQDLSWTASAGATYYTILRNGSSLGSGGCSGSVTGTSCADATATASNCVTTFCQETAYTYQVEACNSSGCSSGVAPSNWLFYNGANQSCGSYSAGGFSSYGSNSVQATFNSGQQLFQVTTAGTTILPQQGVQDASGAIPQNGSGISGTLGQAYIQNWAAGQPTCNSMTATGTGGTGYYCLSQSATSSYSADDIWGASAVGIGGGTGEACGITEVHETGMTYSVAHSGGSYMQQYTNAPGSPGQDFNASAMNNWEIHLYPTVTNQNIWIQVETRPGAGAANTGDVFSNRKVQLTTGLSSSYIAGGTLTQNAWNTLVVPLSAVGVGSGVWVGYVTSPWHGHGTLDGAGNFSVTGTTDGTATNMAVNDYVTYSTTSGWGCFEITGVTTPGSAYTITACPQGGIGPVTAVEMYDANAYVNTITSGVGPDNAGLLTGQSEPAGVFFNGQSAGASSPNTNNGTGHYGLFTGTSAQILAVGSSGSNVTFDDNRYSLYKPAFTFEGTGAAALAFFGKVGWTP